MSVLLNTEPKKVFEYFERLCSVPHGSGNTKIISDLLVSCAQELGLSYIQDELNNVIIFKPASAGMEGHEPVILQGHMDMVCTKEDWVDKDMVRDGLDLVLEGEWLKARGTSLGADDGIAVAIALAILSDDSLRHPPIEAVFTVDEEVGMDGAFGIDLSMLKGRRMLNIDSEKEGEFTASCAGGVRADCIVPGEKTPVTDEERLIEVSVTGLIGGHSGCEIHTGRANANKLMARLLYAAAGEFDGLRLVSFNGGRFDNVICPECTAVVAVPRKSACHLAKLINDYDEIYKSEYAAADPGVKVAYKKVSNTCCGAGSIDSAGVSAAKNTGTGRSTSCQSGAEYAFTSADTLNILRTMFVLPQGVQEMSMDIKGLTQTSLNMGVAGAEDDGMHFSYSIRSCITSQKLMVLDIVRSVVESSGGSVTTRGMYPGWAFNRHSEFRDRLAAVYERLFNEQPVISATHGGLECGLFMDKIKGLDCVSIGPDMYDIHSCAERVSVLSVERLYRLILEFLRGC